MSNDKNNSDGFWDLGDFRKAPPAQAPRATLHDTSANEVLFDVNSKKTSDSGINQQHFSDSSITKFIPPHSDSAFKKKHVIFEYEPQNPFIKKVRLLGESEKATVFPTDNLFMRERSALLDRNAAETPFVPFYSYSPRYSQLTKPQLRYYLWWRENVRNGIFIATEASYLMLYAYELAATDADEDVTASLKSLCDIITNYSSKEINFTVRMMIRDIICDYCLIHKISPPSDLLSKIEPQLINRSFLPEVFAHNACGMDLSMSLYDYKKSKFYTDNKVVFDSAIPDAVRAVLDNENAFHAITSFTKGIYGAVTSERHPFNRMVNIVNKNVTLEVTYFEISNLRPAITDMTRYCENKLREHLGIKNKIAIMSVNPAAKAIIDEFFEQRYPPRPTIDRRRRDARIEDEVHEYDKLYDIPKAEISPERALEIERESWDTTKILTEAFIEDTVDTDVEQDNVSQPTLEKATEPTISICASSSVPTSVNNTIAKETVYSKFSARIGEGAKLIELCLQNANSTDQRRLASSIGISLDELADNINEAALDIVGDIVLESDDGVSYSIIEDYRDMFCDL